MLLHAEKDIHRKTLDTEKLGTLFQKNASLHTTLTS